MSGGALGVPWEFPDPEEEVLHQLVRDVGGADVSGDELAQLGVVRAEDRLERDGLRLGSRWRVRARSG